jgi:hypothetical protein
VIGETMSSRKERFKKISAEARAETNASLASEISSLTRLSEEDIRRLLPRKADKERFGTLMAIVADATDDNAKVAALKENLDEVGGVLVRILKLLL